MKENKIVILSGNAPKKIYDILRAEGFNTLPIEKHPSLNAAEGTHADMQFFHACGVTVYAPGVNQELLLRLGQNNILLLKGKKKLGNNYPENIAYNIFAVGKMFFHNIKYTDETALRLLDESGFRGINVNQGYSACSSAAVETKEGSFIVITADSGMREACESNGLRVLFCEGTENIELPGYDHGFMGGCCGHIKNILYTCGNIEETFTNGTYISSELERAGVQIISLCSGKLKDIGGMVFI